MFYLLKRQNFIDKMMYYTKKFLYIGTVVNILYIVHDNFFIL